MPRGDKRGRATRAVRCKGAHGPPERLLPWGRWYEASPLRTRRVTARRLARGGARRRLEETSSTVQGPGEARAPRAPGTAAPPRKARARAPTRTPAPPAASGRGHMPPPGGAGAARRQAGPPAHMGWCTACAAAQAPRVGSALRHMRTKQPRRGEPRDDGRPGLRPSRFSPPPTGPPVP